MTSLTSFSKHTTKDTVVRLPYFMSLMVSCAVQMVVTRCFSFSWMVYEILLMWLYDEVSTCKTAHQWFCSYLTHFLKTALWGVEFLKVLCWAPSSSPITPLTWHNQTGMVFARSFLLTILNCIVLSTQTLHQPLLLLPLLRSVVEM